MNDAEHVRCANTIMRCTMYGAEPWLCKTTKIQSYQNRRTNNVQLNSIVHVQTTWDNAHSLPGMFYLHHQVPERTRGGFFRIASLASGSTLGDSPNTLSSSVISNHSASESPWIQNFIALCGSLTESAFYVESMRKTQTTCAS